MKKWRKRIVLFTIFVTYSGLIFFGGFLFAQFARQFAPKFAIDTQLEEEEEPYKPSTIYLKINNERASKNLRLLVVSSKLEKSAEMKACDMQERKYFEHSDPEGNEPWLWFNIVDYKYLEAGENIGEDVSDDILAHQKFMESPTHRENVLSPKYTEVGVARCGRYIVEHFGTPS